MTTNFFIVGGPKCGTTAWVEYLGSHPDIAFPSSKEPHFFATDINGTKIADSPEKYESLFHHVTTESTIGDGSVMHLYSNDAIGNIFKYNPDARILILLREQLAYLRSYHNQALYTGYEDVTSIEEAWSLTPERLKGNHIPPLCTDVKMLNYPALAEFVPQVKRVLDTFPPEQICVRWLDEWAKSPRRFYTELMEFLQIEDDGRMDFPKIHGAHAHRSQLLGKITGKPPAIVAVAARIIRRILGVRRLNLGSKLRKLNTKDVKIPETSDQFSAMIRQRYREDRAQITQLLRAYKVPWIHRSTVQTDF